MYIIYDTKNGYESIGESFSSLIAAMNRASEMNKAINTFRYGYAKQ